MPTHTLHCGSRLYNPEEATSEVERVGHCISSTQYLVISFLLHCILLNFFLGYRYHSLTSVAPFLLRVTNAQSVIVYIILYLNRCQVEVHHDLKGGILQQSMLLSCTVYSTTFLCAYFK
ncbi:hypothetical protein GDO81_013673 [Engystomops pustulosus]|uniref:Uncharacterized protein n=1 Tax=Engystomops pustulosus TaxID=76066 RepID=A0AAV7B4Q5_ENGPU|nr:hypothetical protein GDO81_013673 [Engystomops pustulosus]